MAAQSSPPPVYCGDQQTEGDYKGRYFKAPIHVAIEIGRDVEGWVPTQSTSQLDCYENSGDNRYDRHDNQIYSGHELNDILENELNSNESCENADPEDA